MAYTYKDIAEMLQTVNDLEQANQRVVADGLEKFAKTQLNKKLASDLKLEDEDAFSFLESLLDE
jgi:argininosuccinate lyase